VPHLEQDKVELDDGGEQAQQRRQLLRAAGRPHGAERLQVAEPAEQQRDDAALKARQITAVLGEPPERGQAVAQVVHRRQMPQGRKKLHPVQVAEVLELPVDAGEHSLLRVRTDLRRHRAVGSLATREARTALKRP